MWEYMTVKQSNRYFSHFGPQLNNLGAEGWEAVGIVPVEWEVNDNQFNTAKVEPILGVLLKRRIPE
jgi:hypothetical protein